MYGILFKNLSLLPVLTFLTGHTCPKNNSSNITEEILFL